MRSMAAPVTTQKLFNAIVLLGMATVLGCSSDTTSSLDASSDGSEMADNATHDAKSNDAMPNNDAGSDAGNDADAFTGWLGC
jgi:hypothetical protein